MHHGGAQTGGTNCWQGVKMTGKPSAPTVASNGRKLVFLCFSEFSVGFFGNDLEYAPAKSPLSPSEMRGGKSIAVRDIFPV